MAQQEIAKRKALALKSIKTEEEKKEKFQLIEGEILSGVQEVSESSIRTILSKLLYIFKQKKKAKEVTKELAESVNLKRPAPPNAANEGESTAKKSTTPDNGLGRSDSDFNE